MEHPFTGPLHQWDERWFLDSVGPGWSFLFTCIPGTMERMAREPRFGLASDDEGGRRAAVAFIGEARAQAARLNDALRRRAVSGVALHSAPRRGAPGVSSSPTALRRSLEEIASWDWSGAELLLEHCDAWVSAHPPDKGFLGLDDELAACAGLPVRALINWGRSAIETRGAAGPLEHLARCRGRLGGLIFSGTTPDWKDLHAPFAPCAPGEPGEPGSLMTAEAARRCLALLKEAPPRFLGLKIKPASDALPAAGRLALIRAGLGILEKKP